MRVKLKVYLYFAFLLLPGICIGLWLRKHLGVVVTAPFTLEKTGAFALSVQSVALMYVALMRLPLVVFCTGYTVFAPFVGSAAMLYLGTYLGSTLEGGFGLPESALPAIAAALILALLLTVFIYLCGQAASHRHTLRTTAPDARMLLHSPDSRGYLVFFLAVCAVYLGGAILLTYLLAR